MPSSATCQLEPAARCVLQVAVKILTRGRLTVVSPFLETPLAEDLREDRNAPHPRVVPHYNDFFPCVNQGDIWFDGSGTEDHFYWQFLPGILGPSFRHSTLPQVQFSSLLRDKGVDAGLLSQRVDFLITLPDKRIVVELNGPDHHAHVAKDEARKKLLTAAGFEVMFIPNQEVNSGVGANIQRLIDNLTEGKSESSESGGTDRVFTNAVKLAHQMQVTIVEALLAGLLTPNGVLVVDAGTIDQPPDTLSVVIAAAVHDLKEMLSRLASLYGCSLSIGNLRVELQRGNQQDADVILTFGDSLQPGARTICLQDIAFDGLLAFAERPSAMPPIQQVSKPDVTFFMTYLFGHETLREGQYEAISATLTGKDSIVLLPTPTAASRPPRRARWDSSPLSRRCRNTSPPSWKRHS